MIDLTDHILTILTPDKTVYDIKDGVISYGGKDYQFGGKLEFVLHTAWSKNVQGEPQNIEFQYVLNIIDELTLFDMHENEQEFMYINAEFEKVFEI